MKQRVTIVPIFLIFLVLSLSIFFFSQKGFLNGSNGFFEQITVPIQRFTFILFHRTDTQSTEAKLRAENRQLLTLLAKEKEIEKENQALHDQFQTTTPSPKQLLPADVVGMNSNTLIIACGISDGVKNGDIVVVKDNLIGRVIALSAHLAIVNLITQKDISLTAQTIKTSTLGVIKANGEGAIIFDNVVLSDKLENGDIVTTKGDIDSHGVGYPPNLIVGKIISVDKKASNLFQTAQVQSLINFSKLTMIFV